MDENDYTLRLDHLSTHWTTVHRASASQASGADEARKYLLHRYGGAVRRYLLGAFREPDFADEAFQDFATRFLDGRVRGADPERGRFRDYVKGILFHLIRDCHRRQAKLPRQMPEEYPEPAADDSQLAVAEKEFVNSWREMLLQQCWTELERLEQQQGRPYYSVLKMRSEHPGLPSTRMARELQKTLDKPFTSDSVRQLLHRARTYFVGHLIQITAESLTEPTADAVERELIDLGLLEYCQPGFDSWKASQ